MPIRIHPSDNVEVRDDGHKYALRPIPAGAPVVKYGLPIGHAIRDIAPGEHVHTHNLKTDLAGNLEYAYAPDFAAPPVHCDRTFLAFPRPDGQFGIRNDLWVIPTVGCVNALARRLADAVHGFALEHPYGCSQLGDDHDRTANLLAALARHPNAGGVLVVSLGCENNTLESFRERIGDASRLNIRFMKAQEPGDEYERGLALLAELGAARPAERIPVPLSELKVGFKCGGSDGFSGLTANPLVGRFCDWLVRQGGTGVLTEVPEMFGAETILFNRCVSREVFDRAVKMVNGFKEYYRRHNQPIYENPSPGNKAGGISTLEDKSIGCVQKGGAAPVTDVLEYGQRLRTPGLNLLAGPGNDLVSSTALAAAGCHLILFTTGRGTPFGTVVPTLKIASNTALAQNKPQWIDWDSQANPDTTAFADFVLAAASGHPLANELHRVHEIAIFKDGVAL